ncbi:MAG: hypothetical protein Q8P67_23590, partial [archaeon]|nr:hypothetical protein [archaeon]
EAGRVLHREVEATGLQRQFCSLAPEVVHKYLSALDSKEDDKSSSPRFAGSSSSASSASSSS